MNDSIYITPIALEGEEHDLLVGKNNFRKFAKVYYAGDMTKVCIYLFIYL